MPTKRTRTTRNIVPTKNVDDEYFADLYEFGGAILYPDLERYKRNPWAELDSTCAPAKERWRNVEATVLGDWIKAFPGTRPAAWWNFSAQRMSPEEFESLQLSEGICRPDDLPGLRVRLGGVGSVDYEQLYWRPEFPYGIPKHWITDANRVEFYGLYLRGYCFPAVIPISQNDPPQFESQASYLERLGLLQPGELQRLKAKDFESEKITFKEKGQTNVFSTAAGGSGIVQ
jgi:hypothetical protein